MRYGDGIVLLVVGTAATPFRTPGPAPGVPVVLVDDGRAQEARPYIAEAAALGDDEAVTLLAEIDGEDPYDD